MNTFPIAVQPYTVREQLSQDYVGTLTQIAEIGYQGIELGRPPEGMTIAEQKSLLDHLGLKVIGSHAGFDTFDFDPDVIADYLEEVNGEKFVGLSLRFSSKEEVLLKSAKLNEAGEKFKRRGVQLLYHNHDWEFNKFDGELALDIVLRETDPELVKLELDTYWAKRGGVDPVQYLSKLKNRCPLLHIKDMEAGEEQFFAEIGEGILDFHAIADTAKQVGTQWLVVEQDQSRRDPMESLKISFRNLQKLGIKA
ncbi:sugar phosphate isomerase/epimerase [Paenibacillus urinalis]|uniref:Sugar phosphate isomerase/epimerase n=1 Tax=Paenibacillus urinalis TaxID=521520 RepID=A0AAX3MVV0_9BACL|nr:sugar phosphate isomerase/epimerase [Paenibacillus urinalis]WDH80444.1 sugar phosphate isomerase/epimerase [Paenibacillus urinalis]WDH96485.1 sugar phosphate isomerase/epimerase [Paenibacillus urinalis]WDI04708.1 sugar phosphate isomerase/epimerase [Paenibacillus urinalis]